MLRHTYFSVIVISLLFSSCAAREHLSFQVEEDLVLKAKLTVDKTENGTAYRYEIERPVTPQGSDQALLLAFAPGLQQTTVTISDGDTDLFDVSLEGGFAEEGNATFAIPLGAGVRFDSFTLFFPVCEGDSIPILPGFAGLGTAPKGMILGNSPTLDSRIAVSNHKGNPHNIIAVDLSRIAVESDSITGVAVNYAYVPHEDTDAAVLLAAGDGESEAEYSVRLREGETSLFLHEGMCGFTPMHIRVQVEGDGFILNSVIVHQVSRNNGANMVPIPIDMGGVVNYDRDFWRNDTFELFSWNLFPEILIVDTVSYDVQSDFFKRLAFFVEKAGSAGSLLTDDEIRDKHGWNAHDYRADDLARFFSTALVEGFQLGEKEILLRDMLTIRGIIRKTDGGWKGVEGGLIALSQESTHRLRRLFMAHEGYHGIFFSDSSYRDITFGLWNDLSQTEQSFWREFLHLRYYNVNDEYLVVNELQAYLMQVAGRDLEAYYWDYSVPAMVEVVPRTAEIVDRLKTEYPDTFHASALVLETYLKKTYGFGAGDLFCLEQVGR